MHNVSKNEVIYVISYDGETKGMHFLIADGELLEKYNSIWNKVSDSIKNEPIYNKENCGNQNK